MNSYLNHGFLLFALFLVSHLSHVTAAGGKVSSELVCTREDGGNCTDRIKAEGTKRDAGKVVASGMLSADAEDTVSKMQSCYTSNWFTKYVPSGYYACGAKSGTLSSDKKRVTASTQYCYKGYIYGKTTLIVTASGTCYITAGYYKVTTNAVSIYVKYCCGSSTPSPSPPAPQGSSDTNAWLQPHNDARAQLGIPALTWDNSLASSALKWAQNLASRGCIMEHGGHDGMGQNLAWWSGGNPSTQSAVALWVNEKSDYSYGAFPNYCTAGKACGHYTQVVWRKTTKLGCARVTCSSGGIEFVCHYYPPGNYMGQFPY